jgi:hypothetical protein
MLHLIDAQEDAFINKCQYTNANGQRKRERERKRERDRERYRWNRVR